MNRKELFQKNIATIDLVQEMIMVFRRQNFNRGDRLFPEWIRNFSSLVESLFEKKKEYNTFGDIVDETRVAQMLRELMQAQEQKDYVLLADLLELKVLSFLLSVQDVIRMQESGDLLPDFFEKNCSCLGKQQLVKILLDRKRVMKEDMQMPDGGMITEYTDKERSCTYYIEQTSQGAPTLRLTDRAGDFYFHSNHSPLSEARLLVSNYYKPEGKEYCIYGLGLGYHISALFAECRGSAPITVFESDPHIFVLALQSLDFTRFLSNGVTFVYDPDFTLFMKYLQEHPGEVPLIHYPSLRNISCQSVRKRMEELFVQDSSVRNQLGEMLSNFRSNIRNCSRYIDELSGSIAKKDIFLVSAGPSLDKNVRLLKEKPKSAVIVSVGTVYKKLIKEGIRPDFAVFLDASDRIYGQVAGLENETVPLWIASTACGKIAARCRGETYLICQEDFHEAEQYAGGHGYRTYTTGGSVSTIAFDVCIRLGAKRVIAIGLDLAYTGNKIHASNAGRRELSGDVSGLLAVRASDGSTVYTTQAMEIYRQWFEKRIRQAVKETKNGEPAEFINATEGGAYIAGMKYCTLQEAINTAI